ncbi:MAG: AraC family transcriptional regulator [Clostridiales Family XIII bacterium]|jgi:AraC-like DNA-binding protein|nr:AraC family transcriptional regulator [Clostridiales Family XIII bacterium]
MLRQKLYYDDNLPVNVRVCEINEYPIHFHSDPEIIFLLSGELKLKNGYYTYHMKANDIFIMNERDLHSYVAESDSNLAVLLHFDVKYFAQYFPDLENCFLVTDTDDANDPETEALREILLRILMEFALERSGKEKHILENTHTLIALLLDKFQFFSMENGRFVNVSDHRGNKILAERMFRIQNYLYNNFNKKISLQEIADREHLSIYYLSHVIRGATGLSYKEFLSYIRVEESERLLLGTDMKITQISDAVGFSAVRYYVKYFEKWFGMSPAEYREKYKDDAGMSGPDIKVRDIPAEEISLAVKRLNNEVYREYAITSDSGAEEITVKLARGRAADEQRAREIKEWFAKIRRSCRPAALLYDMFSEFDHLPPQAGENHLSSIKMAAPKTRKKEGAFGIETAAIFVFGGTGEQPDCGEGSIEFKKLIKVEGLSGRYRLTILRMNAECSDASLRYSKRKNGPRETLNILDRIGAYPEVCRREITAAGSLVYDIALSGMSSELFVFERIEG